MVGGGQAAFIRHGTISLIKIVPIAGAYLGAVLAVLLLVMIDPWQAVGLSPSTFRSPPSRDSFSMCRFSPDTTMGGGLYFVTLSRLVLPVLLWLAGIVRGVWSFLTAPTGPAYFWRCPPGTPGRRCGRYRPPGRRWPPAAPPPGGPARPARFGPNFLKNRKKHFQNWLEWYKINMIHRFAKYGGEGAATDEGFPLSMYGFFPREPVVTLRSGQVLTFGSVVR